jgi:hypothetical protein
MGLILRNYPYPSGQDMRGNGSGVGVGGVIRHSKRRLLQLLIRGQDRVERNTRQGVIGQKHRIERTTPHGTRNDNTEPQKTMETSDKIGQSQFNTRQEETIQDQVRPGKTSE